jgi:hypothetical protein
MPNQITITFGLRLGCVELDESGKTRTLRITEYELIRQLATVVPQMTEQNAANFAKQVKPVRFVSAPKIAATQIVITLDRNAVIKRNGRAGTVVITLQNFTAHIGPFLAQRKTLALKGWPSALNENFQKTFATNWSRLTGN